VLRLTGSFVNNGTVRVLTSAKGGYKNGDSDGIDLSDAPAEAGVSLQSASPGEYGQKICQGGRGGIGIGNAQQSSLILLPGIKGGGGGGGGMGTPGGDGGGTFVVLAKTAISNQGTINANGGNGFERTGGGGGGIVVLASPGFINGFGSINAVGGDGGSDDTSSGTSGGGGGGIIHLLAPTISVTVPNLRVTGGAAGLDFVGSFNITDTWRNGGAGGGASAGNGGMGGVITTTNSSGVAAPGDQGFVIQSAFDPTDLF
jgi:hypothetical protein